MKRGKILEFLDNSKSIYHFDILEIMSLFHFRFSSISVPSNRVVLIRSNLAPFVCRLMGIHQAYAHEPVVESRTASPLSYQDSNEDCTRLTKLRADSSHVVIGLQTA